MITSTSNAAVKNVVNLCKKAKERNEQGLFIVEGPKMFSELPADRLKAAYVSESFCRQNPDFLKQQTERMAGEAKAAGMDSLPAIQTVSDAVCKAMSDTQTPQGIICVVSRFEYRYEDLLGPGTAKPPLCMILEDVRDPGNLGTIVRTAEGAGVTGILLSRGCVDMYNPKVIRSTMGSVYRVPFAYTDDLPGILSSWKKAGMRLFAAHLHGSNSYTQEDYRQSAGFLIGNESRGLTDGLASMADHLIRIPMQGKVESLNASVAAAILMYEAARQRVG